MAGGRLKGYVALITGAGGGAKGGIGAGIARCLAKEGAGIVVNDLNEEWAEATVQELRAFGAEAWPVLGSVDDSAQADAMVRRTVERFGQLDILVNNAGIAGDKVDVELTSDEQWLGVIQVNLNGPFFASRAAIRFMRPRGFGRIINISSVAGARASLFAGAAYTATKSGLLGFTRHLAAEVSQFGITVNALLPGMTETPLMRANASPEKLRWLADSTPALRTAVPEDIGWAVAFLASREAGYISGTAIPVDGALSVLTGNFGSYRTASEKSTG